jgi:putative addiction module component (TIGR02574 family)
VNLRTALKFPVVPPQFFRYFRFMDAALIEKEALQMPDLKRAQLADRLLQSISPVTSELQQAWATEADDRMEAYRAGKIAAIDGPQALADLRQRWVR